jgi:phage terminase large subunit-like protein
MSAKRKRWHFTAEHLAEYPKDDPARAFGNDVAGNPERHNRWVHLACRRHTLDLVASRNKSFPFVYDCAKGRRPSEFAEQFTCATGSLAGKPIVFLGWQRFCVAMVYGWRERANPLKRRFMYAYVEVPRKNGKTGFVSPLGLYSLAYPPAGSKIEVYSVATKKDIAAVVWEGAKDLLRLSAGWSKVFRALYTKLIHVKTDSRWTPIGSDSTTLDGLRPELAIMDELHAWPSRKLWDQFNDALGTAFSPIIFQITTAGEITEGICIEQRNRVTAILESVEKGEYNGRMDDEPFYFGAIWTIDKGDNWESEDVWHKANPSLGTVKALSYMRKMHAGAKKSEGARRTFLLKQLNIWQSGVEERFLDMDKWRACHVDEPISNIEIWAKFRGQRCWFGLDPSSRRDITALCCIAEDPDNPEQIMVAWDFWVPGENFDGRIAMENLPYDAWCRDGWVKQTEGVAIDINAIKEQVLFRNGQVDLVTMGYDPGCSQGIGIALKNDHSLPVAEVPQGFWLTEPLNEIGRLVDAGKLRHYGNPVAEAHASRAVAIQGDSRIKLSKGKSKVRIDGIAALAMAFAARQASQANPDTSGQNPFAFL